MAWRRCDMRVHFLWKFFVNQFAENVHKQLLTFLNPRCGTALDNQINHRCRTFGETPIATEEADAFNFFAIGFLRARAGHFLDLPLVVKAISTSPFSPRPQICRAKIFIGVIIVADSRHEFTISRERNGRVRTAVAQETAQRNSVARCVASDALPPLPQTSSLWPEAKQFKTNFAARFNGASNSASPRSVVTESSIVRCNKFIREG